MKQSKIEEIIDESFNRLIDAMIKFPENPYHINFEEMFFKGKADSIHKFEKIINEKDKQIELTIDFIYKLAQKKPGTIIHDLKEGGFDTSECESGNCKRKSCRGCIKQYFERKVEE